MTAQFDTLASHQAFVRSIFARPDDFEWTTMGFGMIRTYLDDAKRWRLNVWDDRLSIPNVSTIHDHPWSFVSFIIAGVLHNVRYIVQNGVATHCVGTILTGEAGQQPPAARQVCLREQPPEIFTPGMAYRQELDEVHETSYVRGTVTLNDRTPPTAAHTASVFWPVGQNWVDAVPRPVTAAERDAAIAAALALL